MIHTALPFSPLSPLFFPRSLVFTLFSLTNHATYVQAQGLYLESSNSTASHGWLCLSFRSQLKFSSEKPSLTILSQVDNSATIAYFCFLESIYNYLKLLIFMCLFSGSLILKA